MHRGVVPGQIVVQVFGGHPEPAQKVLERPVVGVEVLDVVYALDSPPTALYLHERVPVGPREPTVCSIPIRI